jgi:hypothetical protein
MQAAEGGYPDWVSEKYLALPDIPSSIHEVAEQVASAAGATTRYEKARAIEEYIRSFEYDVDLAPPSLDRDFVEYFLLDAQRGYCDYSASAMVVMLRTLGVAARYASGYHMGAYDFQLEAWVVNEQNAHAWAEVYFPGIGWVEFEPTPSQRVFIFGEAPESLDMEQPALPQQQQQQTPLWVWGVGLLVIVVLVIVWPPRWFRRKPKDGRELTWSIYEKMVRRARWAGLAPQEGQTPQEYLRSLADAVSERMVSTNGAVQDIDIIGELYQRARYSDQPMQMREGYRAATAWRRLRGPMLQLILVRPKTDRS